MPPGVICGQSDGECTPQISQNRPSSTGSAGRHNPSHNHNIGRAKKKARRREPGHGVQQESWCYNNCYMNHGGKSRQQRPVGVSNGERVETVKTQWPDYVGPVPTGDDVTNQQQILEIYGQNTFEYKTEVCNERSVVGISNNSSRLAHNRSASCESKESCKRDFPATSTCDDLLFEVNNSQHTRVEQVFHSKAEDDKCSGLEPKLEGGTTACFVVEEAGNVFCCTAECQQKTNNDEALQVYDLCGGKFTGKENGGCLQVVKAYVSRLPCSTDSKINAVLGIKVSIYFIIERLPVNDLPALFAVQRACELSTALSKKKRHPTCCLEHLVSPEQESQFGYESHLNGEIMVNGHTLVSNISMVSIGSLRGDKARSHDYSGFSSLRSKPGFEQFHDTCNEATFATLSENRHANYARSSYRAEIVGASKLAGVYSESDAAHKPLEYKPALDSMNKGPANDHKSITGTSNDHTTRSD